MWLRWSGGALFLERYAKGDTGCRRADQGLLWQRRFKRL